MTRGVSSVEKVGVDKDKFPGGDPRQAISDVPADRATPDDDNFPRVPLSCSPFSPAFCVESFDTERSNPPWFCCQQATRRGKSLHAHPDESPAAVHLGHSKNNRHRLALEDTTSCSNIDSRLIEMRAEFPHRAGRGEV
jgi:hypothetical protein